MDAVGRRPYMHLMTRLMLALLALLTGLATQLNTAQARACASPETEIGAIAGMRVSQPCAAVVMPVPAPIEHRLLVQENSPAPAAFAVVVSPVLPGVDRARE